MDITIAFLIFTAAMLSAVIMGIPMFLPLGLGLVCFAMAAKKKGCSHGQIRKFIFDGAVDAMIVVEVMLLIGMITAAWRASGTITFFVYYGAKFIQPSMFVLLTFLLASLVSYALGTSFGVIGTLGLIFMTLARSGGVDAFPVAGAIFSGSYFGDRTGPASSSANVVAAVTKTELYDNVKYMLKTAVLPMLLCTLIYVCLSIQNPIAKVEHGVTDAFEANFSISPLTVIPAVLMLLLPALRIDVRISLATSILTAWILMVTIQKMSIFDACEALISGYVSADSRLTGIMNGGGMISMLEVSVIVLISCTYSQIFSGADMLANITRHLNRLSDKAGRFGAMLILSFMSVAVFCNQTISSIICSDLLADTYIEKGTGRQELAIDVENSVILIAAIVPWSIAASVPFKMLGVDFRIIPYAAFLYVMPVTYIFTKRFWFKKREIAAN